MTDRTPDEIRTDNALDQAIADAAHARGIVDDDQVITGWVVVLAAQGPDETIGRYGHLHPGGRQPMHSALGLLTLGTDLLLGGGHEDDDL